MMRLPYNCVVLAAALALSCSHTHHDEEMDASIDAGVDAGVDSGGAPRDAGRGDADTDAGVDAGAPDAGRRCPPNPKYFVVDGGFPAPDGAVSPYCASSTQCRIREYDDYQSCYGGVCCNGRFDEATCTCSCGAEPECPIACCIPRGETELRCVDDPMRCQIL